MSELKPIQIVITINEQEWIDSVADTHPDIIRDDFRVGLATLIAAEDEVEVINPNFNEMCVQVTQFILKVDGKYVRSGGPDTTNVLHKDIRRYRTLNGAVRAARVMSETYRKIYEVVDIEDELNERAQD